ncbi:MAG TPA: hypothetical protein VMT35_19995, partial [Ignavibacteriaceae bacterium]|nr:hypothetical protein [Ignavibacteriaceae bacterium]
MKSKLHNRIILANTLILFSTLIFPQQQNKFADDFLEFWATVKNNYAYFDKKNTDWDKVKSIYLPQADKAKTRDELITVLENAIEELYDNHFSLNTNLNSSTRLVPSGLDIWAEWINGKAIITEIRKGLSAEKAGCRNGMEIISINDVPIEQAVNNRIGKCIGKIDAEVRNFALKELLAGSYLKKRVIVVKENGKTLTLKPDEARGNLADSIRYASMLDFRVFDGGIGYIKLNNSLGENYVVQLFDSALYQLRNTKALIIDLRETPGGGSSVVARGIMSRFISSEMPYQKHVLPNEEKEYHIKRSWL